MKLSLKSQVAHNLYYSFLLALLVLFVFRDYLFSDLVLSSEITDIKNQFLPWRKYGFNQIKSGHFLLWNPHLFLGAPYFAGAQSALLYH